MKELSAEIEIEAPPERVWQVLTDFAKFPDWNPFIREASGEVKTGARIQVRLEPTGGRAMSFSPKMLNVDPNRELRWLGKLWIPGLFNGEHSFTIEPLDEKRVRFIQREKFTGLLVPFMARSLDRDAKRGFEEMNRALKERAEKEDYKTPHKPNGNSRKPQIRTNKLRAGRHCFKPLISLRLAPVLSLKLEGSGEDCGENAQVPSLWCRYQAGAILKECSEPALS